MNDQTLLEEARKRLKMAIEAEGPNRDEALRDLRFANGEQWESRVKQDRESDMRPCLTINITDAMVRRVTNACRENRPRIKVHPVSDGADKQTSETLDGLIRHIEYQSSADTAYDCAVESAVRGGWGYIRVRADYCDPKSFDQDLQIDRVRNPFTIYPDPTTQTPDGSDYQWVLISELISKDDYKARYGEPEAGYWDFVGQGDTLEDWVQKDMVRVAEYYRIEKRETTLYQLSDGSTVLQGDLPSKDAMTAVGLMVINKRPTTINQVCWYLINGVRVLDRRELPGRYIPVVPVYGRELDLNGKVQRKGMVRDMRDPARMYNYAKTAETEVYAQQPKAPWLVADGQLEGHEMVWQNANRKPFVALPYKPVQQADGSMAPAPLRQPPPPPADGFAMWAQGAQSDFLAVAGMPNDPGQDKQGEVVSGIALHKRQGISDISHYDFYDNLTRSLRQVGRILIDLIPHYYDTPRIIRIVREDGTPESVQINQPVADHIHNDLTVGKYEVVVDTGPSYATKREESAEAQLELLGTPLGQLVAQTAGDVVVRSLDFPNSETVADRLASAIPAASQQVPQDLPSNARALVAGLQGQVQHLQQQLQQMGMELKLKAGITQMQEQAKTEREAMWVKADAQRNREDNATTMAKTHADNVTKRDVAEIGAAAQLLNTHTEAAHERRAAKELIDSGVKESKD